MPSWHTYPPGVSGRRDYMIAKNSCVMAIKILRQDKTLRDHGGTGDAICVLNPEISGSDTRDGSGRTGPTGPTGPTGRTGRTGRGEPSPGKYAEMGSGIPKDPANIADVAPTGFEPALPP